MGEGMDWRHPIPHGALELRAAEWIPFSADYSLRPGLRVRCVGSHPGVVVWEDTIHRVQWGTEGLKEIALSLNPSYPFDFPRCEESWKRHIQIKPEPI